MMTSGIWTVLHEIARKRDETNQGDGHMSDHAILVLQGYVIQEAQDAMAAAMGGMAFLLR
jgi:hypothetical protein